MDSLGTGGAERSNADFWYYLDSLGIVFSVLVLEKRKEGIQTEIMQSGFTIHWAPVGPIWRQILFIRKVIKQEKPDLVHSVLFKSNIRVRLVKAFGVKFVHIESLVNTTYDVSRLLDPAVKKWKLDIFQFIDRLTIHRFTTGLHAITQTVSDHYQKALGLRKDKIRVIYRGRKSNKFRNDTVNQEAFKKLFSISKSETLLVMTGRQEFQKGHIHLIEALFILKTHYDFGNFKCLLLGRSGQMTPAIRQKITELKLTDHILLLGHRNDVEAILAAADIFVFPSLYEGLGGALIEAQAAGLPIVCSDIPVLREVVVSERNALLFPPANAYKMAEYIYRLAINPELRKEYGGYGLKNFKKRFQNKQVHSDLLSFFQDCIAKNNSS